MPRRKMALHRMWFSTDYDADDGDSPDYLGTVSEPFMVSDEQQIVDIDWSVPGEVQVTFMSPVVG